MAAQIKVAIDLDGVLARFERGATPIIRHLWPVRFDCFRGDIVPEHWSWSDLLTKEEFDELWQAIRGNPNFWLNLEPIAANVVALQQVAFEMDVTFLTTRCDTGGVSAYDQTLKWLKRLSLDWGKLIVVKRPHYKVDVIKALGIKGLLDDYPPTISAAKYDTKAFLHRQRWNRHEERAYRLPAVDSVEEFLELMRGGH